MKPAFPKPKHIKKTRSSVVNYADGRQVCNLKSLSGRKEYRLRVAAMLKRQGFKCGLQITQQCRERNGVLSLREATFEHVDGRGMKAPRYRR